MMEEFNKLLLEFGVGKRKIDDPLFANDKLLPRIGLYDEDDENLCHEVSKMECHIPGCEFRSETLLEFENHYNSIHRYNCSQCKKVMPSAHLLDLHIQEKHDSFFAVLSQKKPSFCCYLQECNEKFMTSKERMAHCVSVHKFPKDFRFDRPIKAALKTNKCERMETESYTKQGKRKVQGPEKKTNYEDMVTDLKDNLPS